MNFLGLSLGQWFAVAGVLAYVGTAIVGGMPPKGTPITREFFYGWFYDTTHLIVNSRGSSATLREQLQINTPNSTFVAQSQIDVNPQQPTPTTAKQK